LAVALARPAVVALLQRGAFHGGDSALVAHTLVGFAVGLPFFSVYLFSLRAFYSVHDTRTPFWINCVENAVNIGLALAFIGPFGIPGLAYAFSGAYAVAAVLSLGVLSRRIGGLQGRGIETTFVKVGGVSAVAGVAAWYVSDMIGWAGGTRAVAATVVGAVVGLAAIAAGLTLTRSEEWQDLRGSFRFRRRRRGGRRAGVGR
jgi:putative peptidoglycan lipid II flippase